MHRFDGKTAIVTGAARGIGRAIAVRLASEGARVMIADIDETTAHTTAGDLGEHVVAQSLDVTSEASWTTAVERVLSDWGKIDILVNNAGIAGRSAPLWEYGFDEWNQVIAIDLNGVYLGCKSVVPAMVAAGFGSESRRPWIDKIPGQRGCDEGNTCKCDYAWSARN
jgi:NAD(P)-dependent dehydrogenase (short-subunit alcohol dehydrogenase family)